MNEFMRCHPITNLIYYFLVIGFSVTVMHPAYLLVSLVGSLVFYGFMNGIKNITKMAVAVVFLIVFTAIFNALFNHAGETVLLRFENGNALTKESITFGVVSGIMLGCVLVWFLTLTKVMISEKIMYIFGGIIPGVSLLISMILKFIPEMREKIKKVGDARNALGIEESKFKRAKSIFRVLVTTSLEDGIITADSMKARLYGNSRRTNYSNYRFLRKDIILIAVMLVLGGVTTWGVISGNADSTYFPRVSITQMSDNNLVLLIGFCILVILPVIFEVWEGLKWKKLR